MNSERLRNGMKITIRLFLPWVNIFKNVGAVLVYASVARLDDLSPIGWLWRFIW